ncbi:hypothetical protein GCM10017083_48030 [Thalassobaculum fulvum]|jgi:hypothetical protein|uniref:Bacterial CdiA-CT RNAse A domain-containing protein n=1 Tax=Thalassobaculum fulvum TaxID=1633335 RepID=A0A919CTD2_9PROT|nr:RNase A-like domain-containing protein [Thalassobaculum fulvum]GHD61094.1 hypothetical protein GCM10017083_48030 [Thalassobaculum fulvum]
MRRRGGGALVIGALMLAAGSADAKCVPSTFKDGWLQEQERLGGDTMDRHVGRTATELAARLAKEPASKASSSFPDRHTARQVISAALRPDEDAYDSWAAGAKAGERAEVRMAFEQPIGVWVERGNASAVPAHGITVVLEAMGKGACRLVTAFPTK